MMLEYRLPQHQEDIMQADLDPVHRSQLYIRLSVWRAGQGAAKQERMSMSAWVERLIRAELERLEGCDTRRSA